MTPPSDLPVDVPSCRFCGSQQLETLVNLGPSPLCESYLQESQLDQMEPFYPLHVRVCTDCFLVQLRSYVDPVHIFSEYAYFSSYSDSWLEHARQYVADVTARFRLDATSSVIEIGSNDGYLLRWFVERGIPCLGIEPAANVASSARADGIPTEVAFFGTAEATQLRSRGVVADLVVANNVLAQVPDLNDFVAGMRIVMADHGVATLEFPHLVQLIEQNQFDTIYHEHFSYFSLSTAQTIFRRHGLTVFDVEELSTHGGSLRVYVRRSDRSTPTIEPTVKALLAREAAIGVTDPVWYRHFRPRVEAVKRSLLSFLIRARESGRVVVGYGAPGKGNTLLNYCGIRTDLLPFTVDRNPYKQGRYLPGTRIPIRAPRALDEARPDYVLVLPWNLVDEIAAQLVHVRAWGGRLAVPIPQLRVLAARPSMDADVDDARTVEL